MTDEERERELEREKEKAQRKEERKKAIKNLDTIISSLQELEDLPHVDQNGRRDSSGPRSGGYADSRERWHNTNSARMDSSHHESFSSASTERKGDGEEKERTNSRGNGDDGSKSGGGQRNSNEKENSSSRETNNSKGKEKEGSKKGGLVRLSIFHKRAPRDKEKPARKDSKKKPTKKAGESEQGEAGEENGYIKVRLHPTSSLTGWQLLIVCWRPGLRRSKRRTRRRTQPSTNCTKYRRWASKKAGITVHEIASPLVSARSALHLLPAAIFKTTKGAIWVMQFSPDGRYLATAGSDGVLRVWRVDPKFATGENSCLPPSLSCVVFA